MKLIVVICLLVPSAYGSCINKTVEVLVATGVGLIGDILTKPDPYVVVQIGDEAQQTRIIQSTSNPSWWETFQFNSTTTDELTIQVWEYDAVIFGGDDHLGTCTEKLREASNSTMVQCTLNHAGLVNLYYQCP